VSQFQDNLKNLPSIENIESLVLYESNDSEPMAVLENKPGKAGSLAVYYYLGVEHGGISPASAKIGLELFAEHTADAKANPGAHPNIDRLFDVIENNKFLAVKAIRKN